MANPLPSRQPWWGLSREYYACDDLYRREFAAIWSRAWLFACSECELAEPGDYVTLQVGDAPILVVRDETTIRGFHNICSHRGTLLCSESTGRVGKAIVCPYHQWTYTRDGRLQSCRGMGEAGEHAEGLRPVATHTVAGLVFISLAADPPDTAPLDTHYAAAEPQGLDRAKVAKSIDYRVAANWKIVWENNRECYHCDVGHPQYVKANFDILEAERATPDASAKLAAIAERSNAYWEAEGLSVKHASGGLARYPDPADSHPFPVSATRTVQVDGYESESMDGQRVAPFMGRLTSHEVGVLRLRSVPSFWCHASCDHAVLTRVLPTNRYETAIRVSWLVDAAAQEGADYSLDRLLPFWQLTSEQDWGLCERVARGATSPAFRPGPLSPAREYNLEAFFAWYEQRMAESTA